MSSSDISVSEESFTEETTLPDNIYLYILLAILYLPSSKNTYLKQKIPDHDMDVSYQLKPLINNLNNTSLVTTRDVTTKSKALEARPPALLNNKLSFCSNNSSNDGSATDNSQVGSPFSFEDILTDNDKERVDMVYDNSVIESQGINNTYALDLNLNKKDILELIKYFFSVYTIKKEEAQELKYKIKNYSTEGLVKDIEYYINLLDKDAGFVKCDSFSTFDKYNLWKSNELNEVNKLHNFYKFYLDNKAKKDNPESKNSKLIHLNILEAKNLKPKSGDNRFSNPYFIVEAGGKEFESQVIYKNVNPSWDFSTVIFLKENDTIKITLWNKVTGEEKYDLFDKTVNMFKSSKDHFLGQIILTYAEIAKYHNDKNVLDKWYVLQKRSSKSHISGEIRVSFQFIDEKSLSISHSMFSFIPSNPNVCCQYLIETVINKELECAKNNNTRFIGFSKNAQSLFNSCSILWRINKLFIISKILHILLNEYISNNIDAETLYNSVLIDLKENENILSPKENKRSIKQSLQRLHSYLSRNLATFNDHFFETHNGTDLEKTLFLISYLHRCKFSECYNEDPNAAYQYSQSLIQKGIVARYHSIHASLNSDEPKLVRIIQLIPEIKNEISLYIDKFPRQESKLSIIHSSIEYFINQINDDISEFKVNPKLLKEDLTCSFQLIDELVKLRNKCLEVDEDFRNIINIDDYLIICIQEWLRLTNLKANEWITNSIKLDDFQPQMNEYISSSVIDVFTYCNQIFNFFIEISWPDKKNLKNCLIHLVMIINKSLTVYLDGMRSTVINELQNIRKYKFSREKIKYINTNRKSFLEKAFSSKKSKIEEKNRRLESELTYDVENNLMVSNVKVCICLNNINKCREELASLYERINKVYEDCGGYDDTICTTKELVLKTNSNESRYIKNMNKIENKYKAIFENRNDSYIIQPVQYINEKVESPFLNDYFITFSLMGTPNTLQNSAHTKPIPKYISTKIDETNIYYLELPKTNCTLDICIWHGNESTGYNIYEKTCIVINRDDFVSQPMKEISIKFSDHSQLLVKIKLEDDFIDFYEKQIYSIVDRLLVELQKILVRNMGGDICFAIGFILDKFDNIDIVKNRILNSEKMANYSEPLVTYLQYNLNIFFDKLSNDLDPLNNIIYYIWLECLSIIRYIAIGELEYKPRSTGYDHINCYYYLDQTRLHLTSDQLYSISCPGRVFKGKINDRQIKYLSYILEVLKELFHCDGSGIPLERLEQTEFKEVRSILGHYPCDNRKLKVIYNHYMERNFSLYDHIWILNLLVAKGSSRFIRVKEYEMKVKLEKMLKGLSKKYESSVSLHENHKRVNSPLVDRMPSDIRLYDECIDDEIDSNVSSIYQSSLYANNSTLNTTTLNNTTLINRTSMNRMSLMNNYLNNASSSTSNIRNSKLLTYNGKSNENINNNTNVETSHADLNEETYKITEISKPSEDSRDTLVNNQTNSSLNNSIVNKLNNSTISNQIEENNNTVDDEKNNKNLAIVKNNNINDPKLALSQKMIPYVLNNAQDRKVI